MSKDRKTITLCDTNDGFRKKNEGGITLNVDGSVTKNEREEIHKAVEDTIQNLGFDTSWMPSI